jgi:hypothetical protein
MTFGELSRLAYERWCSAANGVDASGLHLATWDALDSDERERWIMVVYEVSNLLEQHK